jgi:hypothetical protein
MPKRIIVKEKYQLSATAKVYTTNTKWITSQSTSDELALDVARHGDMNIRNKLPDGVNTVFSVGYAGRHEKDVHSFMSIKNRRINDLRDIILLKHHLPYTRKSLR